MCREVKFNTLTLFYYFGTLLFGTKNVEFFIERRQGFVN